MDKSVYKHSDRPGEGAKKRRHLGATDTLHAVMGEYKRGTLRSGSGEHVKSKAQAQAIAISESKKKERR